MPKYIRLSDKKYPFTEKEIKRMFPNSTFPSPFRADDFAVVFPTPKPKCKSTETIIEGKPQISIKGTWEQTWEVVRV